MNTQRNKCTASKNLSDTLHQPDEFPSAMREETSSVSKSKPQLEIVSDRKSDKNLEHETKIENLPSKVWNFYQRVLAFPAGSFRNERKFGIAAYFTALALAGIAITWKCSKPQSTYTEVQMDSIDRLRNYIAPDLVMCPTNDNEINGSFVIDLFGIRTLNISHNIYFNLGALFKLNMTAADLNSLIAIRYESCRIGLECKKLSQFCSGIFRKYCTVIEKSVRERTPRSLFMIAYRTMLLGFFLGTNKPMTLELLWTFLLDERFLPFSPMMTSSYFGSLLPSQGNNIHPIWTSRSYCGFIPGRFIGDTGETSFGIAGSAVYRPKPFDFWLGNIRKQPMNSFFRSSGQDITRNTVAKNLEMALTELTDLTSSNFWKPPQLSIRGLDTTILERENNSEMNYFYQPSIALEQISPSLSLVDTYPYGEVYATFPVVSRQRIVRRSSLTSYSQFQLAAGIISCFVGHSVMQILYMGLEKFVRAFKIRRATHIFLSFLGITALLLITACMAYIDFNMYLDSRFAFEFSERPVPIPDLDFFAGNFYPYSYINVMKVREYNVSLEFYAYMKTIFFTGYAHDNMLYRIGADNFSYTLEFPDWLVKNLKTGTKLLNNRTREEGEHHLPWDKMYLENPLRNFMYDFSKCYDRFSPRITEITSLWDFHAPMSEALKNESLRLSRALGFLNETNIASLASTFLLDPGRFLKHCSVGELKFDCGKYAHYYKPFAACTKDWDREKSEWLRLAFRLPNSGDLGGQNLGGIDHALKISIDSNEFRQHSNRVPYYGPNSIEEWEAIAEEHTKPSKWEWRTYWRCAWVIKIFTNNDWVSEKKISISEDGLFNPASTIINLRYLRFQEKLNRPDNECKLASGICQFPKQAIPEIFRSVQLEQRCGCIECFNLEPKYDEIIEEIAGYKPPCCNTSLLTECYTEKFKIVMALVNLTEKKIESVRKLFELINLHHGLTPPNDWNIWSNGAISQNSSYISEVVYDFEDFRSSVKTKLLSFTAECLQQPCLEKTFELISRIYKRSSDNFINITIYASETVSLGSVETDRFQLAQFIGVLSCSYGFTFGIGLVGLFEILFTGLKLFKGGPKIVTRVIHQHLMKNFGAVPSTRILPQARDAEKSTDSGAVSAMQEGKEEENQLPQLQVLDAEKKSSLGKVSPVDIPNKSSYDGSSREEEEIMKKAKYQKKTDDKTSPVTQNYYELLMLGLLIFSTLGMLITVFNFFSALNNGEQEASVVYRPYIQKPTVFLCADSSEKAKQLWKALKNSTCWSVKTEVNCAKFFKTYSRMKDNRLCFLHDNTKSTEESIDPNIEDLRMAITLVSFDIYFAIATMNSESLGTVNLEQSWNAHNQLASIKISYSVRIMRYEFGCIKVFPSDILPRCKTNFQEIETPSICNLEESKSSEPLNLSSSCSRFQISYSMTLYDPVYRESEKVRYFIVQPLHDIAIVTRIRPKFDFLTLASIVGGYVGTFIELTLFNGVSLIFLTIIAAWKRLRRKND